jgi:hypothetical protein
MLINADADRGEGTTSAHEPGTMPGEAKLSPAAYKEDAVAAVVRATRQRVVSFRTSQNVHSDVATEVFTLEPSLKKGAPELADRRSGIRDPAMRARGSVQ